MTTKSRANGLTGLQITEVFLWLTKRLSGWNRNQPEEYSECYSPSQDKLKGIVYYWVEYRRYAIPLCKFTY